MKILKAFAWIFGLPFWIAGVLLGIPGLIALGHKVATISSSFEHDTLMAGIVGLGILWIFWIIFGLFILDEQK